MSAPALPRCPDLPPHDRIAPLLGPTDESRAWFLGNAPPCRRLPEVLAEKGAWSLREALPLFRQVADLLQYLHGKGLVHGVLYPEVIFVDDAGHCFIGMPNGQTSEQAETLFAEHREQWEPFLAPERDDATGEADSRGDVYSLGALLHWLLVGKAPNGEGLSRHLPRPLTEILEEALDPDPETRLATIDGLTDQLDAFDDERLARLDEELRLASRSRGFDPRVLWGRHPRKVIAALALMAALAGLGYWALMRYEDARRERLAAAEAERRQQEAIEQVKARYATANELFADAQYQDAIEAYADVVERPRVMSLVEPSLAQIARAYGHLEDYGAEYTTWFRLLREYPTSTHAGEANERIVRIAALTVARYGDLVEIGSDREFIVDGLPDDWAGIEPIVTDRQGDARKGGAASDLVAFYAAVSGDTIYFRFDTAAPPNLGDQYCVAVGLNAFAYDDSVEEWDFQVGVARGVQPWLWDLRGTKNYKNTKSRKLHGVQWSQERCVEVAVPLAQLGRPSSVSLRPFLNYSGLRAPNDVCRRKVLVRWQNKAPEPVHRGALPWEQ